MIRVTVKKNQNGQYIGFTCIGHAGYADAGSDIVCAGVSALVINTVNSIGRFTEEKFLTDTDEKSGMISVHFHRPVEGGAELLMKAMVLGLQGIQDNYGAGYLILNIKEV